MLTIDDPDEDLSDGGAGKLSDQITGYLGPAEFAQGCQGQRDGRIEVSAAGISRRIDADENGHAPAKGDDDPATVLAFGSFEQSIGDDAVSKNDDQCGTDHLSHLCGHAGMFSGRYAKGHK